MTRPFRSKVLAAWLSVLAAACAWSNTSSALAQEAGDTVTLTLLVGGGAEYLQNLRTILAAFEAQNPDIKLDLIESSNTNEQFRVLYSSGVQLDLVRTNHGQIATFAKEGSILDLTPMIERDPDFPFDAFYPAAQEMLKIGGRIYYVPFGISVETLFYNKDLFSNAGLPFPDQSWAWDREALDVGRRLTLDANNDGVIDQFFLGNVLDGFFFTILYALGGEVVTADGSRFAMNSPEGLEAIEFVNSLVNERRITLNRTELDSGSWHFYLGNIAAVVQSSYFVGAMQQRGVSFDWDVAPMPAYREGRASTMWAETPWVIPANAAHPEEAFRLLKFIASVEGQELVARTGMATPIHRDVAVSPVYLEQTPPVNMLAFHETASYPNMRSRPDLPNWPQIWQTLASVVLGPVYAGTQPASAALAEAERLINAILAQP